VGKCNFHDHSAKRAGKAEKREVGKARDSRWARSSEEQGEAASRAQISLFLAPD